MALDGELIFSLGGLVIAYLFQGSGGKSKHERFLVIDQEGNFQLRGYNEASAAKKARENDFKKNFGPKGEFDIF